MAESAISFFMPKRRKTRPRDHGTAGQRDRTIRRDQAAAMCSLDIVTGAQNLATLSPTDLFDRERPEDLKATFKLSRNWHKQNWFVEQVKQLKAAFYNYGLRIRLSGASERGASGALKLKEWREDANNREAPCGTLTPFGMNGCCWIMW